MLRTSSARTALIRASLSPQFSTSPTWNTTRHSLKDPAGDLEKEAGPSSSTQPPTTPDERQSIEDPSPTSSKPSIDDSVLPYDLKAVRRRIRDWSEQTAITVRNRADDFTATTRTTLSQVGLHLNKVTGYEAIEALKREVVDQEERINVTRQAARQAKTAYEQAVIQRSNSQREVNDLLQRKSNWTDSDVSRFTTLVRQDHLYEQEEVRAKAAVDEMEDAVEREFSQLMRTILARYHEEQVWSDKIRSASTYGSLAALGLNMLVFVMAIVVVEPWKRRRLAQTFENKIEELSVENAARLDASMQEIGRQLADQERLLSQVAQDLPAGRAAGMPFEETIPMMTTGKEDASSGVVATTASAAQSDRRKLAGAATIAFITGLVTSWYLGR